MNMVSLLVATLAAVVGAAAWGGITYLTNYEIGYVAWGIGLLVGVGAKIGGSSGKLAGVCCGLLALASIFAGKVLAIDFSAPAEVRKGVADSATPEMFNEMSADATAFAALTSENQHAAFMIERNYAEGQNAGEVSPEQLAYFRSASVPILLWMHAEKPAYEAWKDRFVNDVSATYLAQMPSAQFAFAELGIIDIIFAVLGVGTAYKLASMSATEQVPAPVQA